MTVGLERVHGFTFGDSLDDHKKAKWKDFQERLRKVKYDCKEKTFIRSKDCLDMPPFIMICHPMLHLSLFPSLFFFTCYFDLTYLLIGLCN